MTSGPVYLDSGIFIAFLDRSDSFHQEAKALFRKPPKRWYSSLAVISETYGWFLHRLGEESARTFRLLVNDLPNLTLVRLDVSHHEAVTRRLDQFRGRKLTYVDAASLVVLSQYRIKQVWGTDADLAIEGARVVPVHS